MRKAFVACLVGLLAINGAWITSEALAQNRQQGKQKAKSNATRPPPPPAARCPDLGVGTTAFVTSVPGEAPLAANEVAVTYRVSNDGNTPFAAATADDTKVALEYITAAGPIRVAIVPAITTVNEEGVFVLSYGHAERGQIRAVLPPESAGRRLRLRLVYSSEGTRRGIPDCNEGNNTVNLVRPATPTAAPADTPATPPAQTP